LQEAVRGASDLRAFLAAWNRLMEAQRPSDPPKPDPAVAVWPDLVLNWLAGLGWPVARK
jgi:hypothetical protein